MVFIMPKKKSEKRFYLRHKILGTILIILAAWILVWLGQVGVERYKFYQAEKKLDQLSSNLAINPQNKTFLKTHQCNYSSVPYGKGTLRCSIYVSLNVDVKNIVDANFEAKKLISKFTGNDLIDSQSLSTNGKKDFAKDDFTSESTFHEISYSFKFKDLDLSCSFILRPGTNTMYKLSNLVGCSRLSRFSYFPVKD